MDNNSVKGNISKLRKECRLTQTEMADRLGISRNAYRSIESGQTRLINEHIEKIAGVFNKSPEELVLGYMPESDGSMTLEDVRTHYLEKIKSADTEYERQIARLRETVASQNERIRLLEDLVRTKDEIIAMLKRQPMP